MIISGGNVLWMFLNENMCDILLTKCM